MSEPSNEPKVMRNWKKRLLTLRRSKTEPSPHKDVIYTSPRKATESKAALKQRSMSMRELRSPIFHDQTANTVIPIERPAFSKDDIDESSGDEISAQRNTPRSGVRLSIVCPNVLDAQKTSTPKSLQVSNNDCPQTIDNDCPQTIDNDCPQTIGNDCPSSGDEECLHDSLPKQPTCIKDSPDIYQEFVVRPLVVDDYGPMLLRFLSWFDPMNSRRLTYTRFAEMLMERKRKRHFTLVAVSAETGRFICMGSLIVIDSIFGSNLATAIIDSIMIHPEYKSSTLFKKMLSRLVEISELIPDVVAVRLNVQGTDGFEVINNAHKYEKLGKLYELKLNRSPYGGATSRFSGRPSFHKK